MQRGYRTTPRDTEKKSRVKGARLKSRERNGHRNLRVIENGQGYKIAIKGC